MNVIVPMAGGAGSFIRSKYKRPRYCVKVGGRTIYEWSLKNIPWERQWTIAKRDHIKQYKLQVLVDRMVEAKILSVDVVTGGQACTTAWADKFTRNDDPLMIVNPNQSINWDPRQLITFVENINADCCIVLAEDIDIGESRFYASVNRENCKVRSINGKYHSGMLADCGIYYFKYGWLYYDMFHKMLKREDKYDGEYWVAPCFNDAIINGKEVRPFIVESASIFKRPEDVRKFESTAPRWKDK